MFWTLRHFSSRRGASTVVLFLCEGHKKAKSNWRMSLAGIASFTTSHVSSCIQPDVFSRRVVGRASFPACIACASFATCLSVVARCSMNGWMPGVSSFSRSSDSIWTLRFSWRSGHLLPVHCRLARATATALEVSVLVEALELACAAASARPSRLS